ncbi:MAG: BON domain-containing protein, partial [Pseudomonas sp.]|nr:BON domain-containing protein [Pseudomonas sp.]
MKALICLILIGALTGCGSILSATRDTPIESNKGTRTIGSTIDDQLIETKAAVNIAKAHIDLEREARIAVISYNGVVLLTGQVPRQDLKELAGSVTQRVQRVKIVHNELT